MLLRRITEHVKAQNWTAVCLDFIIVVVGVFMGIQLGNWNDARAVRISESDFLGRLHDDIVELQERRAFYDTGRPLDMALHVIITEFLMGERDDLSEIDKLNVRDFPGIENIKGLSAALTCNTLDWSAALTVPPAALPTATELVSSGRVNDIASANIRAALQSYLQQADRANELIAALEKFNTHLSSRFPDLFEIRNKNWEYDFGTGSPPSDYRCDYEAMRQNRAFMNAFALNVDTYSDYTIRGVLPVSEKLKALHQAVDRELEIIHTSEPEATP
ncbi:MAG: hypothetical protein AAFR21_12525 [Pseudomonadota bacterium]